MNAESKKRFSALDSLRGICALSVVLYHLRVSGSVTELTIFRNSYLFVEFFFVLSGFVLSYAYCNREVSFKSFFASRFFRIYPLHIFMLFVFILLEFAKLLAMKMYGVSLNNQAFTGVNGISQIIPNALLIHAWGGYFESGSFNYPSWSISIEFYLYMAFYLVFVLLKDIRVFVAFLIILLSILMASSNSYESYNLALRGIPCFFSGCIVFSIYEKIKKVNIGFLWWSLVEVISFILVVGTLSISTESIRNHMALPVFSICVLIFSFEGGFVSKVLVMKPFRKGGELSYSIYLTHAAVLFCITALFILMQKFTKKDLAPMIDGVRFLDLGSTLYNICIVVIVLLITVFISCFTHKYIELKFQYYGKRLIKKSVDHTGVDLLR